MRSGHETWGYEVGTWDVGRGATRGHDTVTAYREVRVGIQYTIVLTFTYGVKE
jgi:hypothetical protein